MTMITNISRISIQVGLNGYSFKLKDGAFSLTSDWMGVESLFVTPELQKRYDEVEISVFTPKCALVPIHFHDPATSREMLSEVVRLGEEDSVDFVNIPQYAATLVYSDVVDQDVSKAISETVVCSDGSKAKPLPEMYYMLKQLSDLEEYNKILASYMDGYLYLAIAQGQNLLLCNTYKAADFTTAQYFIFLAMKKLQLNLEISSIYFRTPLSQEDEISLYSYFRNVDVI